MAVAWPTGDVPFKPLYEGFSEVIGNNRREFPTDGGRVVMRPKYSARVDNIKVSFIWTEDQYEAFLDFYTNDLFSGTLQFSAIHPRTEASTDFAIRELSDPSIIGYLKYKITMVLEYIA